jgi:hypothetical protein
MKTLLATVSLGLLISIVYINSGPAAVDTVQEQAQPQREKYIAPVWVTNERGQLCIRQGTTVTCG